MNTNASNTIAGGDRSVDENSNNANVISFLEYFDQAVLEKGTDGRLTLVIVKPHTK